MTTPPLTPCVKDVETAKRQFATLYGSQAATITHLRIALLGLCTACIGSVALNIKAYYSPPKPQRIVVRIDDLGRATATRPASLEYHPQEREVRYFLCQFVQSHYSRIRATVKQDYGRSLYFLEGRLADDLIESNKKSNALEMFLAGQGEEVEAKVTNVVIEDLRKPPYRANVDFEKIYYAPSTHQESRREKYVANMEFVVKDQVSNAMVPVNPLGLTITYFRQDQAF